MNFVYSHCKLRLSSFDLSIMGGYRNFFIESKFIKLEVEEGGRYFSFRIFERRRYFIKLVFMGKNAAQWLMKV